MLRISKDQMKAFSEASAKSFEDRMLAHLNRFFPDQCAALGGAGARDAIRHGIQRAASYRITAERDVCKYIDFMFTFGRDFDQDPSLPWASEILGRDAYLEPGERIERLYAAAEKHLRGPAPAPLTRLP